MHHFSPHFFHRYYNNPALNGFPRPPLPAGAGFSNPGFLPGLPNESSSSPVQHSRDSNSKTPETPSLKRQNTGGLPTGIPPHLLSPGAFPGLANNPLMDLSSTQVLINMVRNASNIHQNHLQKTQTDLHNQHHFQKQLLYQQQQLQQQQQQQAAQEQNQQQFLQDQQHKQLLLTREKQENQRSNIKQAEPKHMTETNRSDIYHLRT